MTSNQQVQNRYTCKVSGDQFIVEQLEDRTSMVLCNLYPVCYGNVQKQRLIFKEDIKQVPVVSYRR